MANIQFPIDRPVLHHLIEHLNECGQVFSMTFKPRPSVAPDWLNVQSPLAVLTGIDAIKQACAPLGRLQEVIHDYSKLNRLEFEASLTNVLLVGGCHHQTKLTQQEAAAIVSAGVDAVFPRPFHQVLAYRIDDPTWCGLTDEATMFATYVVWESCRGLWWLLCITDVD